MKTNRYREQYSKDLIAGYNKSETLKTLRIEKCSKSLQRAIGVHQESTTKLWLETANFKIGSFQDRMGLKRSIVGYGGWILSISWNCNW